MSAIDNIQNNIEEFRNNFMNNGIDGVLPDEFQDPQMVKIDIHLKQSHISFIENEIERLEGEEKNTVGRIVRTINDFESGYNQAIQDQIDYYKKTLALIKEI